MGYALKFDTTFKMNFDFRKADQTEILTYLQQNNFNLVAYKGAKGPNQLAAGLPTWFSVPFGHVFGDLDILYTPKYKVFVSQQGKIAANTVIDMKVLSEEIGLGTALSFEQNGKFTSAGSAKPGTITVHNKRPPGTPNLNIGLAGLVNLPTGAQYLPFCAFTVTPEGSINMEPTENVALMASQVNLQSGNVQAIATAPGCTFTFDASNTSYELEIVESSYRITNVEGTVPVRRLESGSALALLNA